jgi:glutamine amidotransferase
MKSLVGLIDYGAGNYGSVRNAVAHLGLDYVEIRAPQDFEQATHLILPGVGAFAAAMRKLQQLHLIEDMLEQALERRKPFLGICVGMQLLATAGYEFETYDGINLVEGDCVKLDVPADVRLPHIGWNELQIVRHSPLFNGMSPNPIFYFVHSYHLNPKQRDVVVATCDYGRDFVAVLQNDNIFGVQFHPEKSQHDGLRLIKNFAAL